MAQYWMKHTAGSEVYGPYAGLDLKQFAAEGRVLPTSLISMDQSKWYEAAKIKGLFATSAPSPPVLPSNAPQNPVVSRVIAATDLPESPADRGDDASAYELAPAAAPAQTPASRLTYYTTPVGEDLRPHKQRNIVPFFVIACAMFLTAVAVPLVAMSYRQSTGLDGLFTILGLFGVYFLLNAIALVVWLVWLFSTHEDLKRMTSGAYGVSPGKAVGFSFIPFFDAYWIVYMPWQMTEEINRHLSIRSLQPISSTAVVICQGASILTALIFPGITPMMYFISMWQIQGGLNRLVAAPVT